ncbi:glycosyltransferase family 2 protein [Polaromonas sp. YR568]|uniref:glycosyltransferase family 2 protein n=1 Tax=Polaromonas sp. YR568 TaxID=1855301 RepID=UPI00398BFE67
MTLAARDIAGSACGLPKVSVVTVVFNGEMHLETTILSVLDQDYPHLEYIVIDGGSTDGTLDIVRKYTQRISCWRSEKDQGIYDAMNKGLRLATGAWINFMNAGDAFHSADTLTRVFSVPTGGNTVIYGGVEIRYPDFKRIEQPGRPARLWQGMQFSHQSAFAEVGYHREHPFNAANRIAADLEFFYQAYRAGAGFLKTEQIVSSVLTGGLSEGNRVRTILASRDAVCQGRARPLIRLYFWGRVISSMFRSAMKRLLPASLVKKLIMLK